MQTKDTFVIVGELLLEGCNARGLIISDVSRVIDTSRHLRAPVP
uniref:Uncharacterized protein n=1 Tax=Arundo donax TaxID=35708 RepID=A0A0A9DEW6_ARUDO